MERARVKHDERNEGFLRHRLKDSFVFMLFPSEVTQGVNPSISRTVRNFDLDLPLYACVMPESTVGYISVLVNVLTPPAP